MAPVNVEHVQEPYVKEVDCGCNMDSDASTDEQLESPLSRTESQVTKQEQVHQVGERLKQRQELIGALVEVVNSLVSSSPGSLQALAESLEEIERQQRIARNHGEDLLEDMLALDSLSNLFAEDRLARKGALADLEVMTDKVDGVKSALLKGKRKFEADLAAAKEREAERAPPKQAEQAAHSESSDAKQETLEAESLQPPVAPSQRGHPELPGADAWESVKLPLRLHSRAMSDGWAVIADLQGLSSEDLQIRMDEDDRFLLRISALRVPDRKELFDLHNVVQRRLGGRSASMADYLRAGEGVFGKVDEAIRLPEDVDVRGVQASCRGGQLRLTLPRKQTHKRLPQQTAHNMGTRRSPRGPADPFRLFSGYRGADMARSPRFPGW